MAVGRATYVPDRTEVSGYQRSPKGTQNRREPDTCRLTACVKPDLAHNRGFASGSRF